jgi:hypothetical protein
MPPVTMILMLGRTASCEAMLMALVTTVNVGLLDGALRSSRVERSWARAVLVVPPLSPITAPGRINDDAATAISCLASAWSSRL